MINKGDIVKVVPCNLCDIGPCDSIIHSKTFTYVYKDFQFPEDVSVIVIDPENDDDDFFCQVQVRKIPTESP